MLTDTFYTVISHDYHPGQIQAAIRFNREHPIFSGHFPQLPVVPGVCMMQIVREIISQYKSEKYTLSSAANIKFLSVINPDEHTVVNVDIRYLEEASGLKVDASIFFEDVVFFKLAKATLHT